MSVFQVIAATATGVLTIEAAAVATGVLTIGAIGAIAVNSMQLTQYDISYEILKFYESDYDFYLYLCGHEDIFTYSINTYGRTIAISRMRANMMYERIHINEEPQEQPQEQPQEPLQFGG